MALKLDMSKTYDRVEWSFLREVMLKLGFCVAWIDKVMMCLASVTYTFKLNGKLVGHVTPERGLRQGDPMSPYLFLLCAEVFSSLLVRAADRGEIDGARVCNGSPRVSHLFFADDSILFSRATLQECSKIADILSIYERASGQKINFTKSEVAFSTNVDAMRRHDIRQLLGVREVSRHEKYLGLPTVIGRSKKMVFSVIKERVWKKLQGWKEKYLSRAGKETLIKAVIQAIPTYMMGLFKIPDGVLDEIHSMCARFWWGARGGERKMHWVSWDKLCLPKALGGMGFRDLKVFNQALLARQGWRLLGDTDSLAYKVLKARYFKNGTFIEALRGHDPSYVWRSIWGAKALLLEGLKWRVGDGQSISAWGDAWLPGDSAARVPTPNLESPADLRVADIIDHERMSWNEQALATHFGPDDMELIRELPLSERRPRDMQFWWPSKDGIFSTKTCYWLGRIGHVQGWAQRLGEDGERWRSIWCVGGPPKLHHFLWRACSGSLATKGRLKERHVVDEGGCDGCQGGDETIIHAIFDCTIVSSIWQNSPFISYLAAAPTSSCLDRWLWMKERLEKEDLLSFAALMWAAWSFRNSVVFNDPWKSMEVGVVGFLRLVEDYKRYATAVFQRAIGTGDVVSRAGWLPPEAGNMKLNTDAYVMEGGGVGLGAVLRDSHGRVVAAGVRRNGARWSVELAEAMAMKWGMQMAWDLGYRNIELESDALTVVKAVRRRQWGRSPHDLVLEDIGSLGDNFNVCRFSHVKRAGNTVAHLCARVVPPTGREYVFVDNFPQGVLALAELDFAGD